MNLLVDWFSSASWPHTAGSICLILVLWYVGRLALLTIYARLTFIVLCLPEPRRVTVYDVLIVAFVAGLSLVAFDIESTMNRRIVAGVSVAVLVALWLHARKSELRENGLFFRGCFVDWSAIESQTETEHDRYQMFSFTVPWRRRQYVAVPTDMVLPVRGIIRAANRFEPIPLSLHLLRIAKNTALQLVWLLAVTLLLRTTAII